MKKLLLISLVIFYSLLSKAFCEDKISIPDGIWHGNLPVGGMILCEANIYKIIVKNNNPPTSGKNKTRMASVGGKLSAPQSPKCSQNLPEEPR